MEISDYSARRTSAGTSLAYTAPGLIIEINRSSKESPLIRGMPEIENRLGAKIAREIIPESADLFWVSLLVRLLPFAILQGPRS